MTVENVRTVLSNRKAARDVALLAHLLQNVNFWRMSLKVAHDTATTFTHLSTRLCTTLFFNDMISSFFVDSLRILSYPSPIAVVVFVLR